jgi:hypothetical protein
MRAVSCARHAAELLTAPADARVAALLETPARVDELLGGRAAKRSPLPRPRRRTSSSPRGPASRSRSLPLGTRCAAAAPRAATLGVASVIQTIPSLGCSRDHGAAALGDRLLPAWLALTLYAARRSCAHGDRHRGVEPALREAARGVG